MLLAAATTSDSTEANLRSWMRSLHVAGGHPSQAPQAEDIPMDDGQRPMIRLIKKGDWSLDSSIAGVISQFHVVLSNAIKYILML
ncbi:hypothetical protein Droror1_Dr00004777 [Drosera rotundifolia]